MAPTPAGAPASFKGICKMDLQAVDETSGLAGQIDFPEGFEGGEAFFVPTDKPTDRKVAGASLTLNTSLCVRVCHAGQLVTPSLESSRSSTWTRLLIVFAPEHF